MGAAVQPDEQVKFYPPSQLVYNTPVDGANLPFDPQATVTSTSIPPIQVDCAVEYFDAEDQPTTFGLIAPARVVITVLDDAYQRIKDCPYIVIHGDRYNYRRTQPPLGLFDVGIYQLHYMAVNET